MRGLALLLVLLLTGPALGISVPDVPALRDAHWGLLVVDLQDGRVLYERDADRRFVPASVQKLYTAAAVLRAFGAEHRFVTEVGVRSRLVRSLHIKDVVLRGGGDPSLSSRDLVALALDFKGRVPWLAVDPPVGRLLVDATRFDGPPLGSGWAWDDETADYSAQISALSVNGNTVLARVTPALTEGVPPEVTLEPAGILKLENRAVTGDEDTVTLIRRRARNVLRVEGTVIEPLEERVTVENPAGYAGTIFARALKAPGVLLAPAPRDTRWVARHESPPTSALVRHMLKESDNLYAEVLARGLPNGLEPPPDSRMVDGSGLSRYNLVKPRDTVALLIAMQGDAAFVDALPISGVDGTLEGRMLSIPGRIRAKTGSMSGVSSLAGYACDRDGRPRWAFAFSANNFVGSSRPVKAAEDALMEALVRSLDGPAPAGN